MRAMESMIKQGNWLFKYRSYLPLVMLLYVLLSMWFQKRIEYNMNILFDIGCLIISLCGEVIRIMAVGYAADSTSGRNTKEQLAAEINQTGIYSLMRHPLYVGNFFMWLGLALFVHIPWIVPVFILLYWLYYERIILAEEDFLTGKFGEAYAEYAARTACCFPGKNKCYQKSKYCFRIKKVLKQENPSLYATIAVYAVFDFARNYIYSGKPILSKLWLIIFITGTLIYLILRIIKKQTRLLKNDPMRINTK